MNDGIKLSAQTSFMEKGAVQCRKSQFMKLTSLWVAQALTKKDVSKLLKIKMLEFIHNHWYYYHPDKFLSHSRGRF